MLNLLLFINSDEYDTEAKCKLCKQHKRKVKNKAEGKVYRRCLFKLTRQDVGPFPTGLWGRVHTPKTNLIHV